MNALEQIREQVLKAVPRAEVEIDRPEHSLGTWWLDAAHKGHRVNVEWQPRRGFGVTARKTEYGEGADEVYEDEELAATRIIALLRTGEQTTTPNELSLQALRENLGIPQDRVAEALGTSQAAVSRIESRHDILLSTLTRYAAAIGGELQVSIRVGDRSVSLGEMRASVPKARAADKKKSPVAKRKK